MAPHASTLRAHHFCSGLKALDQRVVDDLAHHAGQADIIRESIDGAAGLNPTNLNLPDKTQIDWPAYVARLTQIARSFG